MAWKNDEYYVLEYPDWVNVIALTEDGKFYHGKAIPSWIAVDRL